jgi:hypothetical protein
MAVKSLRRGRPADRMPANRLPAGRPELIDQDGVKQRSTRGQRADRIARDGTKNGEKGAGEMGAEWTRPNQ